jgi:predicted metal-dependent hydrolase
VTNRPAPSGTIVGPDGRAKAYRPLPAATRAAAIEEGLAAYDRGDFFEAHELLEPAWMGSNDPAERAVLQGLIKLAAAYVHDVRGNPAGVRKNLDGARSRLVEGQADHAVDVDVAALIVEIDARMHDLDEHPDGPTLPPPDLHRRTR